MARCLTLPLYEVKPFPFLLVVLLLVGPKVFKKWLSVKKHVFWIPGKLAYGETPSQPGYPYGTLVFDVELIGIS